MTEAEAIHVAQRGAAEVGFLWDSSRVSARRTRVLLLFPVWHVCSFPVGCAMFTRVTVPDGSAHATRVEAVSPSPGSRLLLVRAAAEFIVAATALWLALRHLSLFTPLREVALALGGALLFVFLLERFLGERAFRRRYLERDAA